MPGADSIWPHFTRPQTPFDLPSVRCPTERSFSLSLKALESICGGSDIEFEYAARVDSTDQY